MLVGPFPNASHFNYGFFGKKRLFFPYFAENPKEERASDDAITQRFETGCFLCPAKGPVQPVADPCYIACNACQP
jgi:hypothetical protein